MNKKFGFVRVAASVPEMKVANTTFNTEEILKEIKSLEKEKVDIALFPELSITGYTCADLFSQNLLLEKALEGLQKIKEETKNYQIISIIGMPLILDNQLYNCAIPIQKGKILGIVPKTHIPNYNEFYEKRWFSNGKNMVNKEIEILNETVPIGTDLLFEDREQKEITFGIEICEDLWNPISPSTKACQKNATIIFNLSASNEIIGKQEYRKNLIKNASAKNICAYIYTSAGPNESSTDLVFSGYAAIAENGTILKENERFNFQTNHIIEDIDVQKLQYTRLKATNFKSDIKENDFRYIKIDIKNNKNHSLRKYSKTPFVPSSKEKRNFRCEEILKIQAIGLAKRLKHAGIEKCVIGISGGLDSTLAFLVTIESFKILNLPLKNIIGITMPGFGTTKKTLENSQKLLDNYGVTKKEINIIDSSLVHFKDIELDKNDRSVTYENTQARERTQILMDIANKENALVIGTGDLSELALGWCTYNGDHMSMYSVNASIPKTLVKYLVEYFADTQKNKICKQTLKSILDTPISPELLPPDKSGNINQKTENIVGPYILHDFFLYHFFRYGPTPEKIRFLALQTFKQDFDEETITHWLKFFLKRFFNQQFKRSCLPDGPKVGTISLSPRGDLRMPSDADVNIWLNF